MVLKLKDLYKILVLECFIASDYIGIYKRAYKISWLAVSRRIQEYHQLPLILRGCPKLHWTSTDSPLTAGFPCPQYHEIYGYSMYGVV